MIREDGRNYDQLRAVSFQADFVEYPEGSVLVSFGKTRVLCNVTLEEGTPKWMAGKGRGWLTAEYAMLPRATHERNQRENMGPGARSQEIKRLIGRSLRMAVDLEQLGERTITIDCDVLQADGGTRTAAISGGYVAVAIALNRLIRNGELKPSVLCSPVAAISVGIVQGQPLLDLCYREDVQADVDMNVIMNEKGELIEVQATGEHKGFSRAELDELLSLADGGIQQIMQLQQHVLSNYTQ